MEKRATNEKEEKRMTLPIREGQRLGNYRLHRLLGRGSFADVYLGEHLYLQTSAAIKILQKTLDEEEEQLFLAEARTLARLAHPNIIRVREFAIERSLPCLVMDYAPGGTLRRRYPKGTCLSLQQTATTIKQIASALQYAHNAGIIHRDVKPENVLQGADQVLLSDFGISITTPPPGTTTSQSRAGTLLYMAPEQFLGQAVFASDQYALAIMAYEWLCGERPFEGPGTALAYQHVHVSPPRLREKDPSLPEAVDAVIGKALSKHPEQRYVSILTFARALERACRGEERATISAGDGTALAEEPASTPHWRVFLSHAGSSDITRLTADLTLRNLEVLDEGNSSSQDPNSPSQEERTRQAIRAAQVVLLVLTPHTRAAVPVHDHLRIARLYRRKVLCLWQEGETLQELLPAGAEAATILDARGPHYHEAIDELIRVIQREQRGVTNVASVLPEHTFEPRNPYKGLHAFTRQDRSDFFGRHLLVQELLALLKEQLVSSGLEGKRVARLLAVVGPSGSGKSSVVMAGLLPALADGALPGSADWIYLEPLIPGPQPLDALTSLFAACFPEHNPQAMGEFLSKPGGFGLHQLGLTLISQPQMRIVVTIDQFEQIFSSDISEPERQHFLELLVRAVTEPRGPVLVLLTLRADFYDRPFAYPELGRLIQQHQCAVLPMSLDELREVIERPALLEDVRLTFDDDLVGDLLFDLHGQNAALPLLEFALEQLFYHRRQHRLTRAAYHEIGGVRGALAQHAEATYMALPTEEHRRLARLLFLRLVQPGERGQDPLRRRAESSEFELAQAEQTQVLHQVIDAFIAARLITSTRSLGISTLEISHEALLREWPRLALWVREAREDMQVEMRLTNDVREWERRGRPKDRLYRGSQLKEALAWQERNAASAQEASFLATSTARRKRARMSVALVVLLLLALLVPAGVILQQQFTPLSVTTLQDDVPGSLRQTIANARANSTILIDPGLKGIFFLKRPLLINKNLTIQGANANQVTIRGTRDNIGLIQIQSRTAVKFSQLTFSDPTPQTGSILVNQGTLTLDHCVITGNTQEPTADTFTTQQVTIGAWGAIFNSGGTLILQNSLVTHNTAAGGNAAGGGISSSEGTLVLENSQVTDNTAISSEQGASGGGIDTGQDQVTIINSTIEGNQVSGGSIVNSGGGIYSQQSTIEMRNSTVSGNSVDARTSTRGGFGGGITVNGGNVTIIGSHLSDNTVRGGLVAGGALYSQNLDSSNRGMGNVTITASVVSSNTVTGTDGALGGGLAAGGGSLALTATTVTYNVLTSSQRNAKGGGIFSGATSTIDESTIADNSVTAPAAQYSAVGGGIDTQGTLILTRTTISANRVSSQEGLGAGGGIFAEQTTSATDYLSLTNCTIVGNKAQGLPGAGGGFSADASPNSRASIDFCTIVGNLASTRAGGISGNAVGTPVALTLVLKNSLVAGNLAGINPDMRGAFVTGGYNLVQRFTDATIDDPLHLHTTDISGNSIGIDTQLRANGGPTLTLALQAGSPAINAVPVANCDVTTDQRGVKRPQQNACDIGSYEYK
jgi:serine/threonine protein kinase